MLDNIKRLLANDTVFYALVVTTATIAAFGLGRASVTQSSPYAASSAPTMTQQAVAIPTSAADIPSAIPDPSIATSATAVIASKNGTKYHLPSCPGAKQITDANKITFESTAAARAAGYTPAANCKGLE